MTRPKITSDIILFIVSLFIALAVWLVARQSDFENQILSARVAPEGTPDTMEIKMDPPTINVSIQYPKTYDYLIHPEAFTIVLKGIRENLAGTGDFMYTPFNITLRNVAMHDLPSTVRPTALSQDLVTVGARLYTRQARIIAARTGKPADGYRLIQDPIRVEPELVVVTGSTSILYPPGSSPQAPLILETEPVPMEGRKESSFVIVNVPLPKGIKYVKDDKLHVQVQENLSVRVHIVIGEEERQKTITDVPIVIKAFSENLTPVYSPGIASVTVEAPLSMLKDITRESFMFIPRLPLEERAGYKADIALDAKFSDKIPPSIRDKASIISYTPDVIHIEIVQRGDQAEQEEQGERTLPSPTQKP